MVGRKTARSPRETYMPSIPGSREVVTQGGTNWEPARKYCRRVRPRAPVSVYSMFSNGRTEGIQVNMSPSLGCLLEVSSSGSQSHFLF